MRTIVDRRLVRALVAITFVASLSVAHADDSAEAERLYNEGQAAYDATRYDDAIAAWDKAYALSKLPALVFNLAQAHRLAGHCEKAVEHYQRFITLDPQAEDKPAAEQFVKELQPCPTAKPIDKPKVEYTTVDRGAGLRRSGVITTGAGLALVVTGVYFGSRASTLANEVDEACATGCEFSTIADKDAAGRRDAKLQYVFYGLGAAAAAAGVVLYVRGNRAKATRVIVEPRGVGAAVRMTW